MVEPGLGTLEASISTHGNSVVYLLDAGGRYGLTSYLEVRDDGWNALRITGEESGNAPVVIQVGTDSVEKGAGVINLGFFQTSAQAKIGVLDDIIGTIDSNQASHVTAQVLPVSVEDIRSGCPVAAAVTGHVRCLPTTSRYSMGKRTSSTSANN